MLTVTLKGRGDFAEWRNAARPLLARGVEPNRIDWRIEDGMALPFLPGETQQPEEGPLAPQPALTVPRAFLQLAESVICHSNPACFSLLYRLLFRLQGQRDLLSVAADADVAAVRALEKSVRRDSHKMKAFVRFKEAGPAEGGRRRFIAWFEPDHFIVARTAPFFQRRFNDMDWLILTPKGSSCWNGETLETSDRPATNPELSDDADDLWRTYFSHIFNPARLKVGAMLSEMPRKYWRNLPEAELIPGMIASASERVRGMMEEELRQPPVRHERRQMPSPAAEPEAAPGSLAALAAEARTCTRCPLHCHATQTVFGEGREDARLLVVGEQPGDQEDLAGRPFIGPAGKVFDAALASAGIDRGGLYVTNAVKHFKYEPRGKRRIHKRPDSGEISRCRWWLQQEIETVRPKVILAMGATAVHALTGRSDQFSRLRGRQLPLGDEAVMVVTVHPSYLLRLPDEAARIRETAEFERAVALAGRLAFAEPDAVRALQAG